jgi:hypothetical protein
MLSGTPQVPETELRITRINLIVGLPICARADVESPFSGYEGSMLPVVSVNGLKIQ